MEMLSNEKQMRKSGMIMPKPGLIVSLVDL